MNSLQKSPPPTKSLHGESFMESTELKIVWREWDHLPSSLLLGHGVQFQDYEIENPEERLVGFLDGFGWLHGSNEVVIYIIKANARTPAAVLVAMKQRVEELLAKRRLPTQQITSRIYALVNS
jgi:hypothetical protein